VRTFATASCFLHEIAVSILAVYIIRRGPQEDLLSITIARGMNQDKTSVLLFHFLSSPA